MTQNVAVTSPSTATIQGPVQSDADMHKIKRCEPFLASVANTVSAEQALIDANPELKQDSEKGQFLYIPHPSAKPATPQENKDITPPTDKELFLADEAARKKNK